MQLSEYSLDRLRDDGDLVLYRAHAKQMEQPSVLLLTPASTRPSPETLEKIDHEYSLRSELDSAWAVRPLELSERGSQTTLVLDDPGGETLDGFLSGPMESITDVAISADGQRAATVSSDKTVRLWG